MSFWDGFEKQANEFHGVSKGQLAAVLGAHLAGAALGSAVHGRFAKTNKAQKSLEGKAKSHASSAADAAEAREHNPVQYLLNPHVPGPIQEIGHRLARRHYASQKEHPYRTSFIPGYGIIRGGKAGKKELGEK